MTKIRLEFPRRLWLRGRELLLHSNEQITKVLFLEKDVSRRLCQSGTHWQTTIFTALGYHVWQYWEEYRGGLVINIKLHSIRLQLADTDLVKIDQSIHKRLVGQSYHKISLIRFQKFCWWSDDQKSKESSSWFASRDLLSWQPVEKIQKIEWEYCANFSWTNCEKAPPALLPPDFFGPRVGGSKQGCRGRLLDFLLWWLALLDGYKPYHRESCCSNLLCPVSHHPANEKQGWEERMSF